MKILILESDTNKQRQLRTVLSSLGHRSSEVETVTDIKTATSQLRKRRTDVVFINMSGIEKESLDLLKTLRAGIASRDMPVVIYDPEPTRENVIACYEAGATGFLTYPFSVNDVEEVLLKVVT